MLDKLTGKQYEIDKLQDGVDMRDFKIPIEEELIVQDFLHRFVIDPEDGQKDMINLSLMI